MHAPQIIMIVLLSIGGTIALFNHGKPREPYHFGAWLIAASIKIGLLIWGGFFG